MFRCCTWREISLLFRLRIEPYMEEVEVVWNHTWGPNRILPRRRMGSYIELTIGKHFIPQTTGRRHFDSLGGGHEDCRGHRMGLIRDHTFGWPREVPYIREYSFIHLCSVF